MRLLATIAISATVVLATPVSAEPKVGEWRRGTEDERNTLLIYSMGVLAGLGSGNLELERRQQPMFFCQPAKLAITGDQLSRIIDDFLRETPAFKDEWSLSMAVQYSLKRTFPCS